MKYSLLFIISYLLFAADNAIAGTIIKCTLPDGTIEFTNKSCSTKNTGQSKTNYNRYLIPTLSKKKYSSKPKKKAVFLQDSFVQLLKQLMAAKTPERANKQGQLIIQKVTFYAQKSDLKGAYNMTAAAYVKLSKDIKKNQWHGKHVASYKKDIHLLFEDILISQSTTLTVAEFSQIVNDAWSNYQKKFNSSL